MKPCLEFSRWRRQAAEQTLTPEQAAAFREHCRHCSACSQACKQAQLLDDLLRQGAALKAPDNFNQRVWDRIQTLETSPGQYRGWAPVWATAGSVLGLVVLALGAYLVLRPQPVEVSRLAAVQAGEKSAVVTQRVVRSLEKDQVLAAATAVPKSWEPISRVPEVLTAKKQIVQAPEISAPAAAPVIRRSDSPAEVKTAYQPETFRPALKDNAGAPPGKHLAAAGVQATGSRGSDLGLLPGQVQVRPNTLRLGRAEHARLEVNPETAGRLEARIYTRAGRLVRTLVDAEVTPGYRSWEWDGTNDQQEKVAAGIYFLQVRGNVPEQKFKLAVIR
jgi:ferredoxin